MCPRGIPPLRRSSKPTTYVEILSVAWDSVEPPPRPRSGRQTRRVANKTLSRSRMRDDGIQSVRTVGAQVKKLPSRPEGWAFERGSVDELLSRPGHSCAGSHA